MRHALRFALAFAQGGLEVAIAEPASPDTLTAERLSSGIGELIANYTTVSRQGGQLKLLNLTDRIQNLLVITKLLTVFDSYENEAEALKSFQ